MQNMADQAESVSFWASQIFIPSDEKAEKLLAEAPYCKNHDGAGTFAARIRILSTRMLH